MFIFNLIFTIEFIDLKTSPNIFIALVGNKMDQAKLRMVDSSEAENYARENDLLFMETSAKDGMNVADIFLTVCKYLFTNSISHRKLRSIN